jgi:three-Cys-motif partner protein
MATGSPPPAPLEPAQPEGDDETFFSESLEQSRIKALIVADYFFRWAKVMIPSAKQADGKIAYIDLFAGRGRYKDGTKSTPLMVLERAIADPDMRQMLVSMFNDADEDHAQSLSRSIKGLEGIDRLKHKPHVLRTQVDSETAKQFEEMRLIPAFTFIDPFGYKGLSLPLIRAMLKDWGCDCVFFFNYNRINMGLSNPSVQRHMEAIFGAERLAALKVRMQGAEPAEREDAIMEMLVEALRDLGGTFAWPFRFRKETGRVSHYLVFVSKNFKGLELMKEVMYKRSSRHTEEVASFEYDPRQLPAENLELFEDGPIARLKASLLKEHAGQQLTVRRAFELHSPRRPFVMKNYKTALRQLEAAGQVRCAPPADKRPKRSGEVTMADAVVVTFPDSGSAR